MVQVLFDFPTQAQSDAAVCMMHMQGSPGTMQRNPSYGDVVAEVRAFLHERIAGAVGAGIPMQRQRSPAMCLGCG